MEENTQLIPHADTQPEPTFPVKCAWCEAEGNETIIGYCAAENSHGICGKHSRAVRAALREKYGRVLWEAY